MFDEEALSSHLARDRRKQTGAYFTPRALVDRVLDAVSTLLPPEGPSRVVDPACGAGAFLAAAAERWPRAALLGAELDEQSAMLCRARLPSQAQIVVGDALTGAAFARALEPRVGFELWVGNPPYNGTSALLKDKAAWETVVGWLPVGVRLPEGLSLREDFMFFVLRAMRRLEQVPGVLAFITSASLLDAYSYAPIREALLKQLVLIETIEFGPHAFRGTKVRTCATVWSTQRTEQPTKCAQRAFHPSAPEWALRPVSPEALDLDLEWKRGGAKSIDELVALSFPGLKTRFDELLVDDDAQVLFERVRAFVECTPAKLEALAKQWGFDDRLAAKLEQLKCSLPAELTPDRRAIRRFFRYRGAMPMEPQGFCYVDRRLIPRGDHRFRGAFDPHADPLKLVFNQHESPLAAMVLREVGCVTAYRHTRFAPAAIPRALLDNPAISRIEASAVQAPNLTAEGVEWAQRLGGIDVLFEHISRQVMSEPFQRVWAPAFATSRSPLIAPPSYSPAHALPGGQRSQISTSSK